MLGNANNGDNAGSLYLNGNNAVSNANANLGAFLYKTLKDKGESPTHRSNISKDDSEPRSHLWRAAYLPGRICRTPE